MMRRGAAVLLAILIAGVPVAAARRNAGTIPHVLRIVDPQDFVTLNPHLYAATSLSMLSELTMAYFVRYDHRGRPYPELVTAIPSRENRGISTDGQRITWHLRQGVRWSDGAPFTSGDVVFTVRVVRNPRNDEVGRDGWNLIDRIETRGADTVVFHLRKPYASFLPTFFGSAGANPCILPAHILGRLREINSAPYNALPVGIGPFRYVSWRRGEAVVMERNPFYFRGRPKLDRIEFKTVGSETDALAEMRAGEADLWPLVRPGFSSLARALPNTITEIIPGPYFSHLDFNLERPILNDLQVRRALRMALDRQRLRDVVLHETGTLQDGYAGPGSVGYDASIPFARYDLSAANALLDQDRWRLGSDGVRVRDGRRLRLEMAVAGDPNTAALIEEIGRMWRQLGVELETHFYPSTLLFDTFGHGGILARGRFDVSEFAWQGDVMGDLSDLFTCDSVPPKGQNYLRYCNSELDDLYRAMKVSYDGAERKRLLSRVQRILADDVPMIIIDFNDDIYVANSDLHYFHPNAYSPFDDMMDVDI
jgi:peptide/nickel transport system substrate-binding protein